MMNSASKKIRFDARKMRIFKTQQAPPEPPLRVARLLEKTAVDLSATVSEPPKAITIGGEVMGTMGNFSVISGKAKSGKTSLIGRIIASILSPDASSKINGHLPDDKSKILVIDTEQSLYHIKRVFDRVQDLVGRQLRDDELELRKLRSLAFKDRMAVTEYLIQQNEYGLVIIDGVKDLVSSINSEDEATKVAEALMRWSEDYQTHIIAVLHENKGNSDLRGHIGTELLNKAETVLSTSMKYGRIQVTSKFSRNAPISDFELDSLHTETMSFGARVTQGLEKKANKKPRPEELDHTQFQELKQRYDFQSKNLGYDKQVQLIQEILNETFGSHFGQKLARDYLKKIKAA